MIAVGIDPGTSCGVAVVTETEVAWVTLHLPSWRQHEGGLLDGPDRCQWELGGAVESLARMLEYRGWRGCEHWAVEDSQHAVSLRAAAVQAEHLQVVSWASMRAGANSLTPVHPARWQHDLVGALGRDEYVRFARELTGGELDPRHHDAAAAICIAEWCWRQHCGGVVDSGP